jgi:hypothetical protein
MRMGFPATGSSRRTAPWLLTLYLVVACCPDVLQAQDITWLTGPDSVVLHAAESSSTFRPPYHVRVRGYRHDSLSVHLYVSVMDSVGKPHAGLLSDDFKITAADSVIPIERFGVFAALPDQYHTLVLGLGLAGSGPGVVRAIKRSTASGLFAELREEKPDYCALMTFSGGIAVPRLFTSDPLLLQKELSRIHFPGEGLRLIQAFSSGRDLVRQTDTSGFAALIMVCDAPDSGSVADPVMELEAAFQGRYPPIFLMTLAKGPAPWQTPLATWSLATGGEAYRVLPERGALKATFGTIITTLQSQYVLTIPASAPEYLTITCDLASGPISATATTSALPRITATEQKDAPGTEERHLALYVLSGAAILALLILAVFLRSRRT